MREGQGEGVCAIGVVEARASRTVHTPSATALSLGERCGAFFAYDDRLIAAARAHGDAPLMAR